MHSNVQTEGIEVFRSPEGQIVVHQRDPLVGETLHLAPRQIPPLIAALEAAIRRHARAEGRASTRWS